jgi:predicted permease
VSFNFSDGNSVERIDGAAVTHDFASALGVTPIIGRMFTADEDKPQAPPVVLIGEGMWRQRYNGAGNVVGRTLKLNGMSHTIIGVLPRTAEFPGRIRLWVPLAGDPAQPWQSYGYNGVIARAKPGVSAEDAEKDLQRTQQAIWDARDKGKVVSPYARPLREEFARDFRTRARTLFAATAILMFVACANVASVMLARALVRRREMGIRLAVGASRTRLARQLFVENVVLSIAGGIIGLALAHWAVQVLIALAGDQVPRWATFSFDWRIALFTTALTMGTAVLFGWAPALHAVRSSLSGAMHETAAATTAAPGGRRTLSVLVSAEFALAAVLLVCGGLLLRAYDRVQRVDPGFRVDRVLMFSISLPEVAYGDRPGEPEGQRAVAFWDRLVARVAALPGVATVGLVSCPPLTCHWGTFYDVEGRAPLAPGQANPVTLYRPATPGYFSAIGVRLKTGRFFIDQDGVGGHRAIIVNESFVKAFWPGVTDPVGRRIRQPSEKNDQPWTTVVGMVEDLRHYGLERPMRPGVYLPLRQAPSRSMSVVIHTKGDPQALTATAQATVRELDPDLALYRVQTMDQVLRRSLEARRTYSWLLGVFAGMALLLALGGTYGVTTYLVSQRTREMGIRVALGARAADITRAVLRGSLAVVGLGVAAGAVASVVLARQLGDLLFGVPTHDAAVLTGAVGLLVVFAAAANALPARRAARIDPIRCLKAE